MSWRQSLSDLYRQVQEKRHEWWPFADDEFVPASELPHRGATDEEVAEAIPELEEIEG